MRAALGSIERLDAGRYRISIEGKRDAEGKRTRITKVVRGTREDAEIELARMKLDAGRCDGIADGMTVDAAWRTYYEPTFGDRLAPATAENYRGNYRREIRPRFGDVKMGDLTTRGIERGLASIGSDTARDHAFRVFRSFVNYMWNRDLVTGNPFMKRMELRQARRHEQPVMGFEQLARWTDSMRGFQHEAVMLMYPYAGLRRGEGVGLETGDLEFVENGDGVILLAHIRRTVDDQNRVSRVKTERSERTVVVAGGVAARMRYLVSGLIPGRLAQEPDGTPTAPHRLSARYRAWCGKQGLDWYTIQQLRTTYATLSQAAGTDATVVSRALGHTKLSMDYAHYFMANAPAQIAAARSLADSVGYTMFHGQTFL